MTREDLNYWNMSKGVVAHLQSQASLWQSYKVIKEVVDKITQLNNDIGKASQDQTEKDPTGLTKNKDLQYDRVTALALKLANKIAAYALEVEDNTLLNAVDLSKNTLNLGTETEVMNRCQVIVNKAKELGSKVADYNVTEKEADALQKEIESFKTMPAERDAKKGERQAATRAIPELVDLLRSEYRKLDKMISGMIDDETFEGIYQSLRAINDLRARGKNKEA